MVITETSKKIFEFGMRVREARLEDFPLAYMLSYREAIEFYRDPDHQPVREHGRPEPDPDVRAEGTVQRLLPL